MNLGLLTALIEYSTALLEYIDLIQSEWQAQQTFGWAWALPGPPLAMPLFRTDSIEVQLDSYVASYA